MFDLIPGLVSVTSNPVGVEFLTSFIAGTTANVRIAYTATCCRPIVDIRATDARGNFNTQRIHANAGMSTLYTNSNHICCMCFYINNSTWASCIAQNSKGASGKVH